MATPDDVLADALMEFDRAARNLVAAIASGMEAKYPERHERMTRLFAQGIAELALHCQLSRDAETVVRLTEDIGGVETVLFDSTRAAMPPNG